MGCGPARYRFEIEPTFGDDLEFQSLTLDYRRFFFARPVTFAIRGMHVGRYGLDAESDRLVPLYVGRPTLVRGYEIGDIGLSECTLDPNDPGACPEFDRLVGSRLGVLNLRRAPLLRRQALPAPPGGLGDRVLHFSGVVGAGWLH